MLATGGSAAEPVLADLAKASGVFAGSTSAEAADKAKATIQHITGELAKAVKSSSGVATKGKAAERSTPYPASTQKCG